MRKEKQIFYRVIGFFKYGIGFYCTGLQIKTYVVGTQKNNLNETVLFSTRNIYGPCREKKPYFVACEQQRRRPACTSAQSDQRLCYSLIGKYNILTCLMQTFNNLVCLSNCAD